MPELSPERLEQLRTQLRARTYENDDASEAARLWFIVSDLLHAYVEQEKQLKEFKRMLCLRPPEPS